MKDFLEYLVELGFNFSEDIPENKTRLGRIAFSLSKDDKEFVFSSIDFIRLEHPIPLIEEHSNYIGMTVCRKMNKEEINQMFNELSPEHIFNKLT